MLTVVCSAWEAALRSCGGVCGNVVFFASVAPPAIEVSGTPTLRGGGSGYNDEGWYAVAVCIWRLADWRLGSDEAKDREHCGHLRGANGGAANRRKDVLERTSAPVVRGSDMIVGLGMEMRCNVGRWGAPVM